ncbi:MAG: carbohydrate ABC transporter permease [Lachnospiraceae bacterium]|nr:carbohydrate ABC transporter permease [Lachnospiraceae bacterium]
MKKIVGKAVLSACALLFLLPILLTVLHSFTTQSVDAEGFRLTGLLPSGFSLAGYYDLLIEHSYVLRNFWNSVFYAVTITCFNIVVSVPAAYAFSQARFKGKDLLFFFYIMLMMMPLQVTLLPNYIGLRDMKLLDTPFAIVLPSVFAPFSVFLLTQYMKGLEQSYVEAALLETKSVFRIMLQMIVPQLRTCILAVFVFVFAEYWNMVEQADIYLRKEVLKPLSSLLAIGEGLSTSEVLAGSVIFMMPIVILYLYFHDSLEVGLESMKL